MRLVWFPREEKENINTTLSTTEAAHLVVDEKCVCRMCVHMEHYLASTLPHLTCQHHDH